MAVISECINCHKTCDLLKDRNVVECPNCGYNFVMECCRRLQTDFRKCEDCEARFKCWSQSKIIFDNLQTT